MNTKSSQGGYILLLTLLVMSLVVVIAVQIYYTSSGFTSFCQVAVARERAKVLALSGVQMMRSTLSTAAEKKQKTDAVLKAGKPGTGPVEPSQLPTAQFLRTIIPILNRWQKVTVVDQSTTGVLSMYLACDDGKFLLNGVLTKLGFKQFSESAKKCTRDIMAMVAKNIGAKTDLSGSLYAFFQQRKGVWFNEVTEVLKVPGFEAFENRVFVPLKQEAPEKVQTVYLTDLFTSRAKSGTLNPWVLSASVRVALGLNQQGEGDVAGQDLEGALKKFKRTFNWKIDWNTILKPLYGKDFQSLPKGITSWLSTNCEPMFFSVLVHAQVDGITQRLYALLARDEQREDGSVVFNIMKVYWI